MKSGMPVCKNFQMALMRNLNLLGSFHLGSFWVQTPSILVIPKTKNLAVSWIEFCQYIFYESNIWIGSCNGDGHE